MKVHYEKRIMFFTAFIFIVALFCIFVSGCQSTDKNNVYFNSARLSQATFTYQEESDTTYVQWDGDFRNDTIYDIKSFTITFNLYLDGTFVRSDTFNYDVRLPYGAETSSYFDFTTDGKITSIEFNSWKGEFNSFWDTYSIWVIVVSAVACVLAIGYIIFIIVNDQDLSDTVSSISEFVSDNVFILLILLIPAGGAIWGIVSKNWVSVLIVLGGVIVFFILVLLAHLIRFIISVVSGDSVSDVPVCGGRSKRSSNSSDDNNNESIEACLNDSEKLMNFSVSQLRTYCRENGIKGYSVLNKDGLINLIVNHDSLGAKVNSQTGNMVPKDGPGIKFDDIAGLEEAKKAFNEKIVLAFEHKELFEKYGKKVGGGILLYGLPGTGKTMFAEAASHETNSLFIPVKCSDIKSKWYGESEENVKNIFDEARKAKKAIIFFDEFEAIGAKRTDNGENGNNDLVPQILAEMQGVDTSKSDQVIMVIAATNKPWMIDSAFLRPGRFDEKIYIPLPDFEARKRMFELKLKGVPQSDLDYDYLANITDGFNGADIGAFCDKLKMLAIQKSIEVHSDSPVTMSEVEQVKAVIKSSVSMDDMKQLMDFRNQYNN